MAEVALALYWHQHQPYYPDDMTGDNPMPWVRLHGVKDYYGMALHLLEFPEMRCTINLVPSLLLQIEAYTDKGAIDKPLHVSRLPSSDLSEDDSLYLLDEFFKANPDNMIRPFARYYELYQRRALGKNSAREALRRFNERDLRDLQVWFNLAWIHPLAFERDADLRGLLEKGRYFSEQDKKLVLDKHLEILRQVIPLHRKLQDSGQVELTTTPFYHPILPLLFDKKLAREAMPNVKLPRYTGGYPEDAAIHVKRAIESHTRIFGSPPRGMWPAEGSVCQPMIPLLSENGIRWIATDEEVLNQSTQGFVSRDEHGMPRNPSHLYRPYQVKEGHGELSILFRDHALSDRIGFHYQRSNGVDAANDFVQHLQGIRNAVEAHRVPLVSVTLDGENCWEHYADGGVPFLRALYEKCSRGNEIRSVKISEYLEQNPPRDTLPHLFAGSWINHNFAIWVGHEEDNTGWDALHKTREFLKQRAQQPHVPADRIKQAWEEIYIAEGSDWFWWYGDDHSSAEDGLFDYLFRKHLQNVYMLLGETPPAELARAISRSGQRSLHTLPRSFLDVEIDGRETFFEWLNAGRYICHDERGTMAQVATGPITEVRFGFDLQRLLIRVDCERAARSSLEPFDLLRVGFLDPGNYEVLIANPAGKEASAELRFHGRPVTSGPEPVRFAIDRIVEISIPFDMLGVKVDESIAFFVELIEGNQSRDRAPLEGTIVVSRPSPHFEQIMWDV